MSGFQGNRNVRVLVFKDLETAGLKVKFLRNFVKNDAPNLLSDRFSNLRRYFMPFLRTENELSSPWMIFRGLPVFAFFFLSGGDNPWLFFLSLRSDWQDLVVEAFISKPDMERTICSFLKQNSLFRADGGWLFLAKLVPLVIESDGEIILDCSLRLTGKNSWQLSFLLLAELAMEIGFPPWLNRVFVVKPRQKFFFKEAVGSWHIRDVS